MKISILGSGNIGGTLGKLWADQGHEICFGVRDRDSPKVQALLQAIGTSAQAEDIRSAIEFSDLVILALHWQVLPEVIETIKPGMKSKTLLDCTNRMIPPPPDTKGSAAEDLAHSLPETKVVKGFNSLGANNLAQLKSKSQQPSTFICGDDSTAKATVTQLGEEIGFDVVDVGALKTAPLVESLAKLWVQISRTHGREVAFKLLRN